MDTRKRKLVFRAMAHRLVVFSCDFKEAQISFLSDGLLFGIFHVEAKRCSLVFVADGCPQRVFGFCLLVPFMLVPDDMVSGCQGDRVTG